MIELVAFLGNYGREYENTRHNVAWLFEKSLPFDSKIVWQNKHKADFCALDSSVFYSWLGFEGQVKNAPSKIYLLKPMTYMNLSGDSIGEVCHFYKIKAENVLVVHDEIELPFGTVSFKWSGGLGGHNGLRSTKAVLGTADFYRLRFGVGKPSDGNIADYVLGNFTSDERISMEQIFVMTQELFKKALTSSNPMNLIASWGKKKLI